MSMGHERFDLRPINDVVKEIWEAAQATAQETLNRLKEEAAAVIKRAEERIQRIEKNRQAIALLHGPGFEAWVSSWDKGERADLDLGCYPQTKGGNRQLVEKVRTIREDLGCRLESQGKSLAGEKSKNIQYLLRPVDF